MPPKVDLPALSDLHRHLDGSLRPSTLTELAAAKGKSVPRTLPFRAGMGLEAALKKFAFTLSLIQEPPQVKRVAAEVCEDAAKEGVTTLEVRFAPQLHRGAPMEAILDAALEGVAGRAGIILCGLYGEPPAVLESLVEAARTRPGVVGIDLAGGPESDHRWILEDYARSFRRAADLGLGRTVHAGEGRPPYEIRLAIEALGAQRVGHATTLLEEDEDDPRPVVDLVLERGVVVESCPTSNVHTDAVPSLEQHPLPELLRRGVKACINTDNTLLSQTDARKEHETALTKIKGMTRALLDQAIANGHAAAFRRRA
jgi:adenosine deaminase